MYFLFLRTFECPGKRRSLKEQISFLPRKRNKVDGKCTGTINSFHLCSDDT